MAEQIHELFNGQKRYRVPRYQRRYVWRNENWEALWRDLTQLPDSRKHFTGSIITKSDGNDSGDIIIIDGQQRLITFQIIFRLIQDLWESGQYSPCNMDGTQLQRRIFEVEAYTQHDEIPGRYRFLITKEDDRNAFKSVISGECWKQEIVNPGLPSIKESFKLLYDRGFKNGDRNEQSAPNPIQTAYGYFGWEITKRLDEKGPDELLKLVRNLRYQFHVNIANLEGDDDPQQAFGSSNGTGVPLDEFDLLRNDLFLRVKDSQTQDVLYDKHWRIFDDNPFWVGSRPDEFLKNFLMAKLGPEVFNLKDFKGRVFHDVYKGLYHKKLEEQLDDKLKHPAYLKCWEDLESCRGAKELFEYLGKKEFVEFVELTTYAQTYQKMENSTTSIGRRKQFYKDLNRIFKNLDVTSLPPFLLYLENELEVDEEERDQVYKILESYVLRCQLRAGVNEDNTIDQKTDTLFIETIDDEGAINVKGPMIAQKIAEYLDSNGDGPKWRKNGAIKSGLRSAAYQIKYNYTVVEYVWKMFRYIFYRIEGEIRQDANFMPFEEFIESFSSQVYLRPMFRGQKPTISYNIGNLTFGTETVPSNFSPREKREILLQDEEAILELNRKIEDTETWSTAQIEAREKKLLSYFDKIWPPPECFINQKSEPRTQIATGQNSNVKNKRPWVSMIQTPCVIVSYQDRKQSETVTFDDNSLFVCSLDAWQDLAHCIEIVGDVNKKQLKPPQQQSEQFSIEDRFLKPAREEQAIVSLVTRYGHLLQGRVEDIYEEAICMEIGEHQVIVLRTGLFEFTTEILYEGVVKDWKPDNLFGSIKCQSIPDKIIEVKSEFLDQSIVSRKLLPNMKVTFNLNIVQGDGHSHFQALEVEPITKDNLREGRIKLFRQEKGSGIIILNDSTEEIYLNKSQVPPEDRSGLKKDQQVEFNIVETVEGKNSAAINVKVVK
ncbi:MAG: DUF262 domain-containing protein [Candidatus Poribacteria bacterium]|nr:DUF262 domain-containing protein [Candidatus Poribacteria bacterium]